MLRSSAPNSYLVFNQLRPPLDRLSSGASHPSTPLPSTKRARFTPNFLIFLQTFDIRFMINLHEMKFSVSDLLYLQYNPLSENMLKIQVKFPNYCHWSISVKELCQYIYIYTHYPYLYVHQNVIGSTCFISACTQNKFLNARINLYCCYEIC